MLHSQSTYARISVKNMKTKKVKNTKIIVVAATLLAVVVAISLLKFSGLINSIDNGTKNINDNNVNYNPPTNEQIKAGEDIKGTSNDQATTPDGNFTVAISSLFSDDDYLHVRAIINGAITSSGTCELSVSDSVGNAQKNMSTSTYAMPSYSTCQGFDINKSELTNGNLKVMLKVTINGKVTSAEQEYKLE